MERCTMKKGRSFLSLEVLLVALLLLPISGARYQSSQGGHGGTGANLTMTGTVFCDTCSTSSFSNHSYFLPGVKVKIDCKIRVNSRSKDEIHISVEKTTNSYGAYQLDIPAIDGLECTTGGEAIPFCRAAVLDNPSALCNVPAVTTTVGHVSFFSHDKRSSNACLYNLNSLYYRPSKKAAAAGQCGGATGTAVMSVPAAAALNTSLFYCPNWPPWPPLPFCTPRPWFPIPRPPMPPAFPFPLPRWPWTTPPAVQPPPFDPFPHLPPDLFTPPPPRPHLPNDRTLQPPLPSFTSPPSPSPPLPRPFPSPWAPSPPPSKHSPKVTST